MDLRAKLQLLKQVPYFASLPPHELRDLAAGLREGHDHAGDVIFRKGDQCEGLCVVLSGRVRTDSTIALLPPADVVDLVRHHPDVCVFSALKMSLRQWSGQYVRSSSAR